MSRWSESATRATAGLYDERWRRLAAAGRSVHGEADLVCWFSPRSVLDAGCGTGRVAYELHRRGVPVVGVDLDEAMLAEAGRKAPEIRWIHADLTDVTVAVSSGAGAGGDADAASSAGSGDRAGPLAGESSGAGHAGRSSAAGDLAGLLGRGDQAEFDLVVMAGNVMIFLEPGTEPAVVSNMARHLRVGGRLVAGFQLGGGRLTLREYDLCAAAAGLDLEHRWSTWERDPYQGGDYAVSVHR